MHNVKRHWIIMFFQTKCALPQLLAPLERIAQCVSDSVCPALACIKPTWNLVIRHRCVDLPSCLIVTGHRLISKFSDYRLRRGKNTPASSMSDRRQKKHSVVQKYDALQGVRYIAYFESVQSEEPILNEQPVTLPLWGHRNLKRKLPQQAASRFFST